MIQRSISLKKRLEAETVRYAGSQAVLCFYKGAMPMHCEAAADGERLELAAASEAQVRQIFQGEPPALPPGADYWRLMDANGNCVIQGEPDG